MNSNETACVKTDECSGCMSTHKNRLNGLGSDGNTVLCKTEFIKDPVFDLALDNKTNEKIFHISHALNLNKTCAAEKEIKTLILIHNDLSKLFNIK